jgi:hypothetical protein
MGAAGSHATDHAICAAQRGLCLRGEWVLLGAHGGLCGCYYCACFAVTTPLIFGTAISNSPTTRARTQHGCSHHYHSTA